MPTIDDVKANANNILSKIDTSNFEEKIKNNNEIISKMNAQIASGSLSEAQIKSNKSKINKYEQENKAMKDVLQKQQASSIDKSTTTLVTNNNNNNKVLATKDKQLEPNIETVDTNSTTYKNMYNNCYTIGTSVLKNLSEYKSYVSAQYNDFILEPKLAFEAYNVLSSYKNQITTKMNSNTVEINKLSAELGTGTYANDKNEKGRQERLRGSIAGYQDANKKLNDWLVLINSQLSIAQSNKTNAMYNKYTTDKPNTLLSSFMNAKDNGDINDIIKNISSLDQLNKIYNEAITSILNTYGENGLIWDDNKERIFYNKTVVPKDNLARRVLDELFGTKLFNRNYYKDAYDADQRYNNFDLTASSNSISSNIDPIKTSNQLFTLYRVWRNYTETALKYKNVYKDFNPTWNEINSKVAAVFSNQAKASENFNNAKTYVSKKIYSQVPSDIEWSNEFIADYYTKLLDSGYELNNRRQVELDRDRALQKSNNNNSRANNVVEDVLSSKPGEGR